MAGAGRFRLSSFGAVRLASETDSAPAFKGVKWCCGP